LNVDTLWSGGPFETSVRYLPGLVWKLLTELETYNGGNPSVDKSKSLGNIRNAIFRSGTGSKI
jgi:hypothetical protein